MAYPGFIDAHAHWIGDRNYYSLETPAEAMDAAVTRGWTSISEQWINQEKLDLLLGLADDDALQLRVDAYLALNFDKEFFGDWYESREPGPVDDRLRVQGLKIHLDDGGGNIINWEPADLTATIGRADEAGWQVSVHAMSSEAMELVLDAFEAAIGPTGPNPLHHRIEHALQVTDEHLDRMVAMDIATVIHLEGASDWILDQGLLAEVDRDDPEQLAWLGRWRDFVDAGLHVASATDAPWTFPDFELTEDMGRPVDQIAAGMDGRLHETGDAAMGQGPAADRRAGTARGHPGRGLGIGRRVAARAPGAGHAGRRHDPERRRHRRHRRRDPGHDGHRHHCRRAPHLLLRRRNLANPSDRHDRRARELVVGLVVLIAVKRRANSEHHRITVAVGQRTREDPARVPPGSRPEPGVLSSSAGS